MQSVGGVCDMAGQQFEANLGDSGHSGAEWWPHWETGHLGGNRTPAPYLQSNGRKRKLREAIIREKKDFLRNHFIKW